MTAQQCAPCTHAHTPQDRTNILNCMEPAKAAEMMALMSPSEAISLLAAISDVSLHVVTDKMQPQERERLMQVGARACGQLLFACLSAASEALLALCYLLQNTCPPSPLPPPPPPTYVRTHPLVRAQALSSASGKGASGREMPAAAAAEMRRSRTNASFNRRSSAAGGAMSVNRRASAAGGSKQETPRVTDADAGAGAAGAEGGGQGEVAGGVAGGPEAATAGAQGDGGDSSEGSASSASGTEDTLRTEAARGPKGSRRSKSGKQRREARRTGVQWEGGCLQQAVGSACVPLRCRPPAVVDVLRASDVPPQRHFPHERAPKATRPLLTCPHARTHVHLPVRAQ